MNPKDIQTLEKLLSVIKDHGNLATSDEVAKITIEVLKEIKGLREELEELGTDVENSAAKTDEAINAHEGTHKRLKAALEAVSGSVSSLSTNHDALKKLLTDLKEELDSRPGMEQFVQEAVARSIAAVPPHQPCPTDTADDIRNKLELLKGDDRLDRSAIRGLEEVATSSDVDRAISILDKRTSFLINKAPSGGGTGTVTNVSSANTDIGVASPTTTPVLTLNSGIGANQIPKLDGTGQLGVGTASPQTLVHLKNTTGSNGLTIENTTANGKAFFYITDNYLGTNFAEFDVNSSGTAGTNLLTVPNSMVLRSGAGATGGQIFVAQANAPLKFATGGFANGNVRMTIDGTGGVTLASLTNGIVKSTSGLLSNATGADLPAMTSTVGGAVPTPPNNTTTFLRGDGTWASPPAGGSGITRSVNVISTSQTAGATALTDYVYLVSGTTTLTLPTAVGNTNRYSVKRTGSGVITINTTSAQTIDGSASVTLTTQYTSLELISDGANWNII